MLKSAFCTRGGQCSGHEGEDCQHGKFLGLGLSGERLGSLKECTRRGWEELETMGRGGMVLAPRGIEYRVWSGFGLAMAEIGCNWARIGPSKSSQSLSNAHKWAVVID
ncbi:hypothetical protein Tco_1433946 [Tanacetum coccineum]